MTVDTASPSPRGRILCLHGDGTNAEIFEAQLRRISQALASHYELVCVNGPFECAPGYGVSPFFDDCGPFYRWLRLEDSFDEARGTDVMNLNSHGMCNQKIGDGILDTFRDLQFEFDDDEEAFDGILGFSSSGSVVAGILKHQQCALAGGRKPAIGFRFRFGILINGQGTPVALEDGEGGLDCTIKIPTVQTVGLKDEWKESSIRLNSFFDQHHMIRLDLDNDHSVPSRLEQVEQLAKTVAHIDMDQPKTTCVATC